MNWYGFLRSKTAKTIGIGLIIAALTISMLPVFSAFRPNGTQIERQRLVTCYSVPPGVTIPKYVLGKGIWGIHLYALEGGDLQRIVNRMVENNIDYLILKTSDGGDWMKSSPPKRVKRLAEKLHRVGKKLYAWPYVYGTYPEREAERAIEALKLGTDGLVFNIEAEFSRDMKRVNGKKVAVWRSAKTKHYKAETLLSTVRQYVDTQKPDALVAYSSFCNTKYWGKKLPLEVFDKYCDVNMPQAYWRTLGCSPTEVIDRMCTIWWGALEASWKKQGITDSPKPIIPIGHAYRRTNKTQYIPHQEVAAFALAAAGYYGVSWYTWDFIDPSHWRVIRDSPGGRSEKVQQYLASIGVKPAPGRWVTVSRRVAAQGKTTPNYLFVWGICLVLGIVVGYVYGRSLKQTDEPTISARIFVLVWVLIKLSAYMLYGLAVVLLKGAGKNLQAAGKRLSELGRQMGLIFEE